MTVQMIKMVEKELTQAIELLTEVVEDRTVPRNIRENTKEAKEFLLEKTELNIKIDRAIQLLDEVSEDPNMPVYTRTQIWNIVSLLESALSQ
jgi:uncharacterized protein (UPF0147 family)